MAKNYNMYNYGTSPRKLEPEYAPRKKTRPTKVQDTSKVEKKKQEKENNKKKIEEQNRKRQQIKLILYIAIGFFILFAISYRNSQMDEEFSKIQSAQKELEIIQKENEQLKVNVENGSNLNNLEQAAKELLGMQKLSNRQSVYVSLPKVDYIEGNQNKIIIFL